MKDKRIQKFCVWADILSIRTIYAYSEEEALKKYREAIEAFWTLFNGDTVSKIHKIKNETTDETRRF